jgi:dynein heavy chain
MKKVKENPIAIGIGTRPGLLEMFQKHNENLDVIQKNLELYLEQKRLGFPRFYFLGDDDLLDILSQSKNPEAVQPHMGKMFDAMKEMKFGADAEVFGFVSNELEEFDVEKPFKARGEVEKWLVKVEDAMRGTLYRDTKQGIKDFGEESLDEFLQTHICMVTLTVMQIYWSQDVEERLKHDKPSKQLKNFYEDKVA